MFPSSIRMHIVTFLLVFVLSGSFGQDRKILPQINPGCENCLNKTVLVYVKATGSHDTIHQVWDFTQRLPTVIFAIGSANSTINITWNSQIPQEFVFNEKPEYGFAAVIDKLIEYDDLPDDGRLDLSAPQRRYDLKNVEWEPEINATVMSEREAKIVMTGHFPAHSHQNGTISMKLDFIPYQDYAVDLPHLIHTANSTLVDIKLINMTTDRGFNSSRWALHFLLASTDDPRENMTFAMPKSLDDEHTPGVFEIVEIRTPESARRGDGGFIQYRPVAYTEPERSVTTSTNVYISDFNHTRMRPDSIVAKFFAKYPPPGQLLVEDLYISFGEPGDGFYKQHNYTAWSFTMGYGSPPVEGFSRFVIIIICIGLGLPVVLALSGVVHVVLRRRRARNNPMMFADED